MGAPPGTGPASSTGSPVIKTIPNPTPPAPKSGPTAPPPAPSGNPDSPQFLQAPPTALQLMGVDEKRLQLGRGLRLYNGRHLDSAKLELKPLNDNALAVTVLDQIQTNEAMFHSRQLCLILKALGQDAAQTNGYSAEDLEALNTAIQDVEAQLILSGGKSLEKAIQAAQSNFSPEVQKIWRRFSDSQKVPIAELSQAFLETDQSLLASDLLRLAELNRDRKLFGTAWALAQLASEFPATEKRAKDLSAYLEGKRTSTEYVISDMFDHGGSSMAIDLLALIPSVALTRRLSTAGWLLKQRSLVRVPLTLLAGGAIHWGSTKALKLVTGYDGKILPGSVKEFAGEITSSTLQNSLALFLANRKFMWGRPMATREAVAVVENAEAAKGSKTAMQKFLWAGKTGGRAAWWTTKTSFKLGLIGSADLLLGQFPLHYLGVKDMTPKGLSRNLLPFFPKTRETRDAVAEIYASRRLFKTYHERGGGISKMPNTIPGIEAGLDLDLLVTQLDPGLEGSKREAAYVVLTEAAADGRLGLNIRRWILQKKKLGELAGANATFARQKIPLRYEADGNLCFSDSTDYPCENPPAAKP
ncbi:MAG: hypothetical protein K8R69_07260 [Deltaproteobacteria bacterium]|nr:hypothetical protein [Deltaproteobacteria bacterium]